MKTTDNNNLEYLELKNMLSQLATMLNLLIPKKVSVSYLAESTGKSRQSVHKYLMNNFEPEIDFWREGGKTYVNKDTAISILQRSNSKKIAA
jgi:hypothetical protein